MQKKGNKEVSFWRGECNAMRGLLSLRPGQIDTGKQHLGSTCPALPCPVLIDPLSIDLLLPPGRGPPSAQTSPETRPQRVAACLKTGWTPLVQMLLQLFAPGPVIQVLKRSQSGCISAAKP